MAKKIVTVDDICSDDDEQDEIEVKPCEECKDRFRCPNYAKFIIRVFFMRIKRAFGWQGYISRAFGLRKARKGTKQE